MNMKMLTALLLAMALLLASTCCAESLMIELGLTAEPKPAVTGKMAQSIGMGQSTGTVSYLAPPGRSPKSARGW